MLLYTFSEITAQPYKMKSTHFINFKHHESIILLTILHIKPLTDSKYVYQTSEQIKIFVHLTDI